MTKNSIIGLATTTVIAAGAIGGYAFYQDQEDDKNNNEDEVSNFQECQEKEGALSGDFNQTCTYENKDYTRELTDQEKLTKITTFEECESEGGVVEENSCTIYGGEFEKLENAEEAEIDWSNYGLDENLKKEIAKLLSGLDLSVTKFQAFSLSQKNDWGSVRFFLLDSDKYDGNINSTEEMKVVYVYVNGEYYVSLEDDYEKLGEILDRLSLEKLSEEDRNKFFPNLK